MHKVYRIDQLADGIFSIIMTLLILDLRIPTVGYVSDAALWRGIVETAPLFLTFFISFLTLFTYWRAHHFIVSTYAKNLTGGLANYNAIFFILIGIIPFSSKFVSSYPGSRVPIIFYGINVILIGLALYFMRRHVERSPDIETVKLPIDQVGGGYIRILLPVFFALIALILSIWDAYLPIILFSIAIIFNLLPGTSSWLYHHLAGHSKH
ncbi:MAG TPA: TMEM175 family protein [Candidatus Nanoarchaeia archaeon]|nr:TMEM175 family protein [Candidatus Nanoarchaeia archaeon]